MKNTELKFVVFIRKAWTLILALAHVGGLIAFGCTVAGFFGNHSWICDILANGRYVYCCYLGFVLLFSMHCRHRALLSLWIIGILLNLYDLRALVFPGAAIAANSNALRVTQMNIEKDNHAFFRILNCIQSENPDVLVLQELQPETAALLKEKLPQYRYSHVFADPGYGGMGILSKFTLKDKGGLAIPGGFLVLSATVVTELGPVSIYNIHPSTPVSISGWNSQKAFFARLTKECYRQKNSVIVVGDYNCTPMSVRYKEFLNQSKLVDAQNGFGWHATWMPLPNLVGRLPLSLGSLLMIPIDHCCTTRDLIAWSRQTASSIDSDHLPVTTVLAKR